MRYKIIYSSQYGLARIQREIRIRAPTPQKALDKFHEKLVEFNITTINLIIHGVIQCGINSTTNTPTNKAT